MKVTAAHERAMLLWEDMPEISFERAWLAYNNTWYKIVRAIEDMIVRNLERGLMNCYLRF